MFSWLFDNKRECVPESKRTSDQIVKAKIADKLKHYDAARDATTSDFSLPDAESGQKYTNELSPNENSDVWGQANPSDTGKWYREGRLIKERPGISKLYYDHRL